MSEDSPRDARAVATRTLHPDSTHLFPRKYTDYPEVVRGEGPYLYDRDGNEFLDAASGNQCSNLGHGLEEIARAAADQLRTLEYASSVLFVNDRSQAYAERLAAFLPDDFEHVWLCSGGSEANESAYKLAREYHLQTGNTEKHVVVGRRLSFHGNTLATAATSGLTARRRPFVPMLQDWPHAPAAYPYRCRFCADEADCRDHGVECAKELETVVRDVGPEYVAAFVAEPVVGASNAAAVPGAEYLATVREVCDEYEVLFVADEVMCGMGRTGRDFAVEHWGVTPDIITTAKGLSAGYAPLGAAAPRTEVAEAFADRPEGFSHGHTNCFNPATSAVGLAVLEYMERHDVVENAARMGRYLREELEACYAHDIVGDVRGKGLMLGVEFVGDRERKTPLPDGGPAFRDRLFRVGLEHGLVVYPGGGTVDGERGDHVLLTPPLTLTREQADLLLERFDATLATMQVEFGPA